MYCMVMSACMVIHVDFFNVWVTCILFVFYMRFLTKT